MPLSRHLPENAFSSWLNDFSIGLTYGILLAELIILLPVLKKLHKKINELIGQII
jgi:hypothetical protein